MPKMFVRHPDANYDLPSAAVIRIQIGQRIRQLREKFGMSQIELARNLGKESATYTALIEKGARNIAATELVRLASHFKVDLSFFQDS